MPEKQMRPPPDPPAVPAVACVNVRVGGPNNAHWKALCAKEPGIEPPLMTTEDYYALRSPQGRGGGVIWRSCGQWRD